MNRRKFLQGVGVAGIAGLAGCGGNGTGTETESTTTGTPAPDLPSGAYIPTHMDMMNMIGMKNDGGVMAGLMYTRPHEFWVVTGQRTNKTTIKNEDSMHLMAMVKDMESGVVAPQVEPTISIFKDDEQVGSVQPWPMLSQPMGYHFGDNVTVSGEGTYRFEVTVNAASSVLSGDLADVFTKKTFTFEQEFEPAVKASQLGQNQMGDRYGNEGVIPPMEMDMMQVPQQPEYADLPVDVTETQYTDDLGAAVGSHATPGDLGFEGGENALVVPVQTRYNRYLAGFSGLEATVTRAGEEVFSGDLSSAVDRGMGHYYGASTPALESGDDVTVSFVTPPQGARHEGYDKAFLELDDLSFTLP